MFIAGAGPGRGIFLSCACIVIVKNKQAAMCTIFFMSQS
jgi:hypothetical protein